MKQSDIFLEAAKRIFSGNEDCCCLAIRYSSDKFWCYGLTELEKLFNEYFTPKRAQDLLWYGDLTPQNQLARQLALLLMWRITLDEEKKTKT